MTGDMLLLRFLAGVASGRKGWHLLAFTELDHIEIALAMAEARRLGFVEGGRADPKLTTAGWEWAADMLDPLRPLIPDAPQIQTRRQTQFEIAEERRRIVRAMDADGESPESIADQIGCGVKRVYVLLSEMREEA